MNPHISNEILREAAWTSSNCPNNDFFLIRGLETHMLQQLRGLWNQNCCIHILYIFKGCIKMRLLIVVSCLYKPTHDKIGSNDPLRKAQSG
jgi:hypothetical protein